MKEVSLVRKPGSGRRTPAIYQIVEAKMKLQLQHVLNQSGFNISLATTCIKRRRKELGWTFQGSRYCQLIREPNKSLLRTV
jgi:hypothetical protein